jgi:molecular chaperone GrpE
MSENCCEHDSLENFPQEAEMAKKNEEKSNEIAEKSQESEVSRLSEELRASNDRFLRLAADFENFKRISAREHANGLKFANEGLILNLLPMLDNLEQAITMGKRAENNKDLIIGLEMVHKQMIEALAKYGVDFFSAMNEKFDPIRHEAVSEREDNESEPGTVIEEFQKGCMLYGRLIRAARVTVAKKAKE